jgi:hypothetical protein
MAPLEHGNWLLIQIAKRSYTPVQGRPLMRVSLESSIGEPLDGILEYDADEYSFRFKAASPVDLSERAGDGGLTSLSIGTLQIEVGVATRTAIYVWGLHPRTGWQTDVIPPPRPVPGLVRVASPDRLLPGVSLDVGEVPGWSTRYDQDNGWVRVAAEADNFEEEQILIASDTVLGLRSGELRSLWLRPVFD